MLAGVAFVAAFALVGANPEPTAGSFYDDLILLAAGLAGFHALQKGNYGRLGVAGFYAAVVAAFVEVAAFVARLLGTPLELLELLGILGLVAGLAFYGAATLRARVLPHWCGAGLIAGLPAWVVLALVFGVAGAVLGAVLFGLLWVALGFTLRLRREAATEQQQPARVV